MQDFEVITHTHKLWSSQTALILEFASGSPAVDSACGILNGLWYNINNSEGGFECDADLLSVISHQKSSEFRKSS